MKKWVPCISVLEGGAVAEWWKAMPDKITGSVTRLGDFALWALFLKAKEPNEFGSFLGDF